MTSGPPPRSKNVLIDLADDGLPSNPIKPHTRDKLFVLGYCLEQFTGAMHEKFPNLVFTDLFAGPGRNEFEDGSLISGSPLIAAATDPLFTRLVFVESDPEAMAALRERVARDYANRDVEFVPGNCNEVIDQVISKIPRPAPGSGVLTFCFVDPFDLGIHIETLRRFGDLWVDFIVLVADQMAGERDTTLELPGNLTIDRFLGDSGWREKWQVAQRAGTSFRDFLVDGFTEAMKLDGFLAGTPMRVNVQGKGVRLYKLLFFSRKELGVKFREQAVRKAPAQERLFS